MGQAIEQRGREFLITGKDRDPLGKREIGCHDGGPALVPVGDQIEEELAADAVERDEAELIDLCGAPHKSINATPAVMWSQMPANSPERTASGSPTSHYG